MESTFFYYFSFLIFLCLISLILMINNNYLLFVVFIILQLLLTIFEALFRFTNIKINKQISSSHILTTHFESTSYWITWLEVDVTESIDLDLNKYPLNNWLLELNTILTFSIGPQCLKASPISSDVMVKGRFLTKTVLQLDGGASFYCGIAFSPFALAMVIYRDPIVTLSFSKAW